MYPVSGIVVACYGAAAAFWKKSRHSRHLPTTIFAQGTTKMRKIKTLQTVALAALCAIEFYGQFHADSAVPVPEPSTYAMLLAGLGLVGIAVRHRVSSTF
jgi:hypothetical protein